MQMDPGSLFKSSFWGICIESGKKYSQVVSHKFHISMAALDPTVVSPTHCVSLMVERGECSYLLCTLVPDKIQQVNLNLYFEKGEKVTFSLRGVGMVHLSGYHIFDKNDVVPSVNANMKVESTISNECSQKNNKSPIKKQSSISKPITQLKKNAITVSGISSDEEEDSEESVKELKIPTATQAKVVPAKQTAKAVSPKKDESSEDDDSDEEDEDEEVSDSRVLQQMSKKRPVSSMDDDSSDDLSDMLSDTPSDDYSSEESSAEENEKAALAKKLLNESKKFTSTPVPVNKAAFTTPKKNLATELDNKSGKKAVPGDMNTSIGRTPMPKKKSKTDESLNKPTGEKSFSGSKPVGPSNDETNTQLNPPEASASAKKKKRKRKKSKGGADDSTASVLDSSVNEKPKEGLSTAKLSQKMPGGLEFDDIRVGNGPPAKKGKLVHVYYTGTLDNNKVFDACKPGTKPFSFKLGSGQVIKGWDFGLEGMKVGGKRKLKIPAAMGYGSQRQGPIPANSTLHFTVELKAVS